MPEQEQVDIWRLADLCTPWCVHVVATLRVAEYIAAGTSELRALERPAGLDVHAAARQPSGRFLVECRPR